MQQAPSFLSPLKVLLARAGCRLNIKPLNTSFASKKKKCKGRNKNGLVPMLPRTSPCLVYQETQIQPLQAGSGCTREESQQKS